MVYPLPRSLRKANENVIKPEYLPLSSNDFQTNQDGDISILNISNASAGNRKFCINSTKNKGASSNTSFSIPLRLGNTTDTTFTMEYVCSTTHSVVLTSAYNTTHTLTNTLSVDIPRNPGHYAIIYDMQNNILDYQKMEYQTNTIYGDLVQTYPTGASSPRSIFNKTTSPYLIYFGYSASRYLKTIKNNQEYEFVVVGECSVENTVSKNIVNVINYIPEAKRTCILQSIILSGSPTSFSIDHNIGSRFLTISVYEYSSNYSYYGDPKYFFESTIIPINHYGMITNITRNSIIMPISAMPPSGKEYMFILDRMF